MGERVCRYFRNPFQPSKFQPAQTAFRATSGNAVAITIGGKSPPIRGIGRLCPDSGQKLGQGLLGRGAPLFSAWSICQLHDGRRCDARFFTVTGAHVEGTPAVVEERSGELQELHAALFPPEEAREPVPGPTPTESTTDLLSDGEVIAKASAAANGQKFKALWSGNWQGMYPSQSEADEAMCCELAFWTGRDPARMDALFRQSGLYRQKWERSDYRGDTLARAVARTAETYTLSKRERVEKLYAALAAERTERRGGTQTPAPAMAAQQNVQEGQETGISMEPGPVTEGFVDFRYGQTDLGNSERFIRQHGNNIRYCVETKTWHRWN